MIMCISKFYSLFLHIIKDLTAVCIPTLFLNLSDNFRTDLKQASLTQSIALDIIFYRNIVISKMWHYAKTYKTDKSIFEAVEEYLLEEVATYAGEMLTRKGEIFSDDMLYWIGYIYRYWHHYNGEGSAKIYKQAPALTMKRNYMIFHTMDPFLAIEDLKEIHNQK
mgnify:FL=1